MAHTKGAKDPNLVPQFLNRMLGLEIARQEQVLAYFTKYLEKHVKIAKREDNLDTGVTELAGRSLKIVKERKIPMAKAACGALTMYTVEADRGCTYKEALAKLSDARAAAEAKRAAQLRAEKEKPKLEKPKPKAAGKGKGAAAPAAAKAPSFKRGSKQAAFDVDDDDDMSNFIVDDDDADFEDEGSEGDAESQQDMYKGFIDQRSRSQNKFGDRDGFYLHHSAKGRSQVSQAITPVLVLEVGGSSVHGVSASTGQWKKVFPFGTGVADYGFFNRHDFKGPSEYQRIERMWTKIFNQRELGCLHDCTPTNRPEWCQGRGKCWKESRMETRVILFGPVLSILDILDAFTCKARNEWENSGSDKKKRKSRGHILKCIERVPDGAGAAAAAAAGPLRSVIGMEVDEWWADMIAGWLSRVHLRDDELWTTDDDGNPFPACLGGTQGAKRRAGKVDDLGCALPDEPGGAAAGGGGGAAAAAAAAMTTAGT